MTAPSSGKKSRGAPPSAGNVQVVVRIRPLSSTEKKKGCDLAITSMNQDLGVDTEFYAAADGSSEPEVLQLIQHHSEKRWFEFDAVLGDRSTQEEAYRRSGAKQAVEEEIFKGYNATLLAYGQTGAGKTYTMGSAVGDGEDEHAGILHRSVKDLFKNIQKKCDGNGRIELSYLEIYNEELRDLLHDNAAKSSSQLKIRETLDGEVYVSGITSKLVSSPGEIGQLLEEASKRRVVASTAMNAVSSRSHAICTFKVSGVLEGSEKFASKLTLVDLAGSERIKKTGAAGSRALEGIHINKSLMVLGQVVSSLSDSGRKKGKTAKPPYRDSKLTRLLQDSLGGNSRTIMMACVSPADYNVEESANTLRYATAARNIKNTATRNMVKQISPEEAAQLQRENQLLKQEVAELQEALRKLSITTADTSSTISALSYDDDEADLSLQTGETAATLATSTTTSTPKSTPITPDVAKLKKQLTEAKLDVRKTAGDALIELPALKVEIEKLKGQLEEKEAIEKENQQLRQDLEEARADAAGARRAAIKLTDVMDQLRELKQDQVQRKRVQLQHKLKEKEWVDFVAKILDTRTEQINALQEDFDLVIKVVESPAVYQMKEKNRWFGRKEVEEVYDRELREKVLREHVQFFKDRMDAIQNDIFARVISLQGMRDRIQLHCSEMEKEIGTNEIEALDMQAKEQDILGKLVHMLIDPAVEIDESENSGRYASIRVGSNDDGDAATAAVSSGGADDDGETASSFERPS